MQSNILKLSNKSLLHLSFDSGDHDTARSREPSLHTMPGLRAMLRDITSLFHSLLLKGFPYQYIRWNLGRRNDNYDGHRLPLTAEHPVRPVSLLLQATQHELTISFRNFQEPSTK